MTINSFMYIYIGENGHCDIYAPLANHYTKFFFNFFFFFHFRCILLQISHKKCFFISISILGRSGVPTISMIYLSTREILQNIWTFLKKIHIIFQNFLKNVINDLYKLCFQNYCASLIYVVIK